MLAFRDLDYWDLITINALEMFSAPMKDK